MGDWMDDSWVATLTFLLLLLCPLHNGLQGADWMMKCTLDFSIGSSSILPSNDDFLFNITDSGTPLWTSLLFFASCHKQNTTTQQNHLKCKYIKWIDACGCAVSQCNDIRSSFHGDGKCCGMVSSLIPMEDSTIKATQIEGAHFPQVHILHPSLTSIRSSAAVRQATQHVFTTLFFHPEASSHKKTTVSTNSEMHSTIFETVTVPPSSFPWAMYLWRTSSTICEMQPPLLQSGKDVPSHFH